jgi:predicted Ser/Thr protein kinase
LNSEEIDKLFEIYFGCMRSEYYFIQMLKAFITSGMEGYGREYVCCVLASAFKEGEEEYFGETGVMLCINEPAVSKNVEIIVSNEEFLRRLKIEYSNYLINYPEKAQDAINYFEMLEEKMKKV